MVINCNIMKKIEEQLQKELNSINNKEKKFPKGELRCAKNKNRYKWFVKKQKGTSYLPKTQRDLAEKLAEKKYYSYKKQELEGMLAACRAYLKIMQPIEGQTEKLLYHPEYSKLLDKHFVPLNETLLEWQNTPYEHCNKYEEALIVKGTQGKMLRSKSEAIIDMVLYKNKIPFRYEEKLALGTTILYPDFVIRHPMTGKYYYWEHFGMMDDEEYRSHTCNKIRLYCENGIIPTIKLITTFETKDNPLSIEKVEMIVQEYFMNSYQ